MKKDKKELGIGTIVLLFLAVAGVGIVALSWWPPTEKIDPQESCALLPPEERDECCARVMADQPHVMCVGRWVWKNGACYYECSGSGLSNPASVKCLEDGGILKIASTPKGQVGYCFFADGSVCEEWAYYKGECKPGDCSAHCGAIGSRSEGWYDCHGNLLFWDNCRGKKLPE